MMLLMAHRTCQGSLYLESTNRTSSLVSTCLRILIFFFSCMEVEKKESKQKKENAKRRPDAFPSSSSSLLSRKRFELIVI